MTPKPRTDLGPGVLGALVLVVGYFALEVNLGLAIVTALIAYGVARWVTLDLPERRLRGTFADAQRRLLELRRIAMNLQDKEVQKMVQDIDGDIDRIIGLAYRRRQHLDAAQHIVDRYLDTTIELLRRYQELYIHRVHGADDTLDEVRRVFPVIHQQLMSTWDDLHRDDVVELQHQVERLRSLVDPVAGAEEQPGTTSP